MVDMGDDTEVADMHSDTRWKFKGKKSIKKQTEKAISDFLIFYLT
jgi:hypothetical protein